MAWASLQRPWTRTNRSKAGSTRPIFSRNAEQFAAGISRTGTPRSLAKLASLMLVMMLDVPKTENLWAVGGAVEVSARGSFWSNDGRVAGCWRTGILGLTTIFELRLQYTIQISDAIVVSISIYFHIFNILYWNSSILNENSLYKFYAKNKIRINFKNDFKLFRTKQEQPLLLKPRRNFADFPFPPLGIRTRSGSLQTSVAERWGVSISAVRRSVGHTRSRRGAVVIELSLRAGRYEGLRCHDG